MPSVMLANTEPSPSWFHVFESSYHFSLKAFYRQRYTSNSTHMLYFPRTLRFYKDRTTFIKNNTPQLKQLEFPFSRLTSSAHTANVFVFIYIMYCFGDFFVCFFLCFFACLETKYYLCCVAIDFHDM